MASLKLTGDTSGEITISSPAVAGTNTLTLPATTQTLATQNSLGVRNLIINGDMRIAQRKTSSSSYSSGDTYLTLDRWRSNIGTAGTWTMSQDTDVPSGQGFGKSMKWQCTTANGSLSAGSFFNFCQYFEGQNLQHMKKGTSNAESLTLSFWVKSNKTGTYIADLFDVDTPSYRYISKSYTINTADTWEKKTITFAGDTTGSLDNDNARSLDLRFWLVAGTDLTSGTLQTSWGTNVAANRAVGQVNLADSTSNYINITGIQLEIGTEATEFEHRPFDMELRRCQRYFEHNYGTGYAIGSAKSYPYNIGCEINGFTTTSGQKWYSVPYKVTKRAVPNITFYDANGNAGKVTTLDLGGTPTHNVNIGITFVNDNYVATGASNGTHTGVTWFFASDAEL